MISNFNKGWLLILCIVVAYAEPNDDLLDQIPGYGQQYTNRGFAGYLKTQSDQRKLYYLFLEGNKGINNSAPVLLWLNGGPGCSSIIGLVMQLGPYCLGPSSPYEAEDPLTPNSFGWTNTTNLLFIDSPAGTGYSLNQDPNYLHTDANTAKDLHFALKDFFTNKFPQYSNNTFFLAGQSYAGKYIPDLATRILADSHNIINLKGLLIGNPILNMGSLQHSRVEWMISHNFIDPQLLSYWHKSCKVDPESAGCQFFYQRFDDLTYNIDPLNIYGQCFRTSKPKRQFEQTLQSGQSCTYDSGLENYLKVNAETLHSKNSQVQVCNSTIRNIYKPDSQGSIAAIPNILKRGLKVYLYTGDWDDYVPFSDTYSNLELMGLKMQGGLTPWTINDQHAGFIRNYSFNLTVYQVKGAGHMVPLYQRERAFKMFQKFVYA